MQDSLHLDRIEQLPNFLQGGAGGANILPASKACYYYEGALIKQALAQANGRVTHAASLLGMSYQALCYIIESRHKDLLKERSPVVRRRTRKEPQEN